MIEPGQIYRTTGDSLLRVEEVTDTHVMWRWANQVNARVHPCQKDLFAEDIALGDLVEEA